MAPRGGQNNSLFIAILVAALIIIARNSRPRKLKIERLWLFPVIYLALLVLGLYEAPPPMSPLSIGLLLSGAVLGALLGWQRGRFTHIQINPGAHEMTSRASVLGIAFILLVMVARTGLHSLLAQDLGGLGVSAGVLGDALLVLAVAMLSVQRLEIWLRASRMLEAARAAKANTPGSPPQIVQ